MVFRWTGLAPARHDRRVLFLIALLSAFWPFAPGWAATVERVDIERTRIVVHFDAPVANAASFLLAGPSRIAVDVAGASPGAKMEGGGRVSAIRQAARKNGARIVFDLVDPAVVTDGGFGEGGRALTLSLKPVDDRAFVAASLAPRLDFFPFNVVARAARPRYKLSIDVPPPARPAALPRVRGDDDRPLVVIDPGHGGVDPGAISPTSGLREKDVTLKIAKAIRDELLASGRVRVALTREDDRYLVLRERYGIARRLKANLFISIHCDSVGAGTASGATAYTLSEVASDKEAARLAARENKADVISGVDLGGAGADVSSILIDLAQRETMNSSADFARLLGREAKPLISVKENFHRMASLMVLKAPDMPSILFETGYISNDADAALLDSKQGRTRIAESVRRAVDVHFARRLASR